MAFILVTMLAKKKLRWYFFWMYFYVPLGGRDFFYWSPDTGEIRCVCWFINPQLLALVKKGFGYVCKALSSH